VIAPVARNYEITRKETLCCPVKSMAGERLAQIRLDRFGFGEELRRPRGKRVFGNQMFNPPVKT
jgi:hypothetical protein